MGCWWSKCRRSDAKLNKPQQGTVHAPASAASAVAMEEKDSTKEIDVNTTDSPTSRKPSTPSSHISTPQGKSDVVDKPNGDFEILKRSSSETASLRDATSRDHDARKRLDKVHRRGRLNPSDSYSGAGSSEVENSDSDTPQSSQATPSTQSTPPESSDESVSEKATRLSKTAKSGHRKRDGPFESTNRHKARIFDSNSSLNMTRGTDGEIVEESKGEGNGTIVEAEDETSSSSEMNLMSTHRIHEVIPSSSSDRPSNRPIFTKEQDDGEYRPFKRNNRSELELHQDRTDVELTSLDSNSHERKSSNSTQEDEHPHSKEDMTRFRFPVATPLNRSSVVQQGHHLSSPAGSTLLTSPSPFSTTEDVPTKVKVTIREPKPPLQKAHSFHRSHPNTTVQEEVAEPHSESPQNIDTARSVPFMTNGGESSSHLDPNNAMNINESNLKTSFLRSASSPANLTPLSIQHDVSEYYDSSEDETREEDGGSFGFGHSTKAIEPPGTRHLPSIGKMEQETSAREVLGSSQSSMVVRGISAEALAAQVAQVDEWRDSPSVGAPHPALGASLTISAPSRSSSDRLEHHESVMADRINQQPRKVRYGAPITTTNAHVMAFDPIPNPLPNPIQLVEDEATDDFILSRLEFGPSPLLQKRGSLFERPLIMLSKPLYRPQKHTEAISNLKKRTRSHEETSALLLPSTINSSLTHRLPSQLQIDKEGASEDDYLEPPLKRVANESYTRSLSSHRSHLSNSLDLSAKGPHFKTFGEAYGSFSGGEEGVEEVDFVPTPTLDGFSSEWSQEMDEEMEEEEHIDSMTPWYEIPSQRPRLTYPTDGQELMYYDDEDWFGGEGADRIMGAERSKDEEFNGTYEFNTATPLEVAMEAQSHSIDDLLQLYRAYFYWDVDFPVIFRQNSRYRYSYHNAPRSLASISPASRARAVLNFTRYKKANDRRDDKSEKEK